MRQDLITTVLDVGAALAFASAVGLVVYGSALPDRGLVALGQGVGAGALVVMAFSAWWSHDWVDRYRRYRQGRRRGQR